MSENVLTKTSVDITVVPPEPSRLSQSGQFRLDDLTTANRRSSKRNFRKGRRTWGNHSLFGDFEIDTNLDDNAHGGGGGAAHDDLVQENQSCWSKCPVQTDGWCTEHNERCWRGLKHCLFFVVFAVSFMWTSIAKLALIVDVFATTLLFFRCSTYLSFQFDRSAFDVLAVCLIRCLSYLLLFSCKCKGHSKPAWPGVTTVTLMSMFYTAVKIGAIYNGDAPSELKTLVLFQLGMTIAEVTLFHFLRKRPIRALEPKSPMSQQQQHQQQFSNVSAEAPVAKTIEDNSKLELDLIRRHSDTSVMSSA
eukprot:TRINITY_DN5679_c0_g1_i4.p1 TRINITY_DN5679_c0_g1~~TRINITY_DN5679_c0_g1_i4.p1  ORF type:complete len:315 (-),score=64.04 TRINITY_DN5679_c0_g1_i4:60-974(-)